MPIPPREGARSRRRAAWLVAALLLATSLPGAAGAGRWNWSGAITLDHTTLVREPEGEGIAKTGAVVEWSLKTTVDVSDEIAVNTKVCTSCHGITVDQAYAEIRLHPRASLEAGRINVPFGDFYLRHDPANDAFLTKPLPYAMGHMLRFQSNRFNLGVIPMPYVDHGASLFGDVWIREALQVWYAVYGVNGFRSEFARDFTYKNQVANAGFHDNNDAVSWGARVALAQGPFAAGASFLRGAYDPEADFDYLAWGVDASVYFSAVQVRGEYLERETDVLDGEARGTIRKKGFYAQVEAPAGRYLSLVGRLDGLLREGAPLGTENDDSSAIVRWTAGVNVKPTIDYAFRVQYEHWRFTDFPNTGAFHLGVVITY